MTKEEFVATLCSEGFDEMMEIERAADIGLDEHAHPFESKALILAGEIRLVVAGQESLYRAGDVFHLEHGRLHCEHYGPDGVRYLVGRKRG